MKDFEAYISDLREMDNPLVLEMEEFAKEHRIPIMDRSGMETFIGLLRIQRPKFILEIGSAIGYSAIRMVSALEEASVVTIERDKERHASAVEFIKRSGLSDRITIIEGDALLLPDEALPSYAI